MEVPASASYQPRNRRKQLRSRNGCQNCKLKRVKCDETKPACLQCINKAVACPGYCTTRLQWSTKHEVFQPGEAAMLTDSINKQSRSTGRRRAVGTTNGKRTNGKPAKSNAAHVDNASPYSSVFPPADTPSLAGASPLELPVVYAIQSENGLDVVAQRLQQSTIPVHLHHLPTVLVGHYFDYVCTIFSTFDTSLNPFRTTVGNLWQGWAPMYYTIQSMAAAYLANDFPYMRSVGVQMQQEAYRYLQKSLLQTKSADDDDRYLLTLLLLGLTTSWHKANDLGLQHQRAARTLLQKRKARRSIDADPLFDRQTQFFHQCFVYWEMLTAFMADNTVRATDSRDCHGHSDSPDQMARPLTAEEPPKKAVVFPHPWTGVTPTIQLLFARVGALVRQDRACRQVELGWLDYLSFEMGRDDCASRLREAQQLEEELLAFDAPTVDDVVDPNDEKTPVQHFLDISETYRLTGLLILYRKWPEILCKRMNFLRSEDETEDWQSTHFSFMPEPQTSADSNESCVKWLTSFALHILTLLRDLPSSSGTRFMQPIILLAVANELRFPPLDAFYQLGSVIDMTHVEIAKGRRFILTRLHEFQSSLPAQPIMQVESVVKETWKRLDAGIDAVFWLDIMIEEGLETIMG